MTSWFSALGGEVDLYMCEMEAERVHVRAAPLHPSERTQLNVISA